MIRLAALLTLLAGPAMAETIIAARTIPARTVIAATDILVDGGTVPGAASEPAAVIGAEAKVALYAGRPIRPGDIGVPAVVERNEIIPLIYSGNGLFISTDGRALDRASPGEVIRVMNISSRNTVSARITEDGAAYVTP